jgi:hypothetical protein
VAGEVVHDDDVATPLFGNQHLGDVGLEGVPVDGSVEHPWRDEAPRGERADEGRGLPVSMRDADPQPCPATAAPVAPGHVGGGPGLVDEDQPLRVEIELILEPLLAPRQDVGAILLGGVCGLFLRVILWRLRKRRTVPSHVAQNTSGRSSAIDAQTTRHAGYAVSQRIRKTIEEAFGWMQMIGGQAKTKLRGEACVGFGFAFSAAAYNLVRMPKLLEAGNREAGNRETPA